MARSNPDSTPMMRQYHRIRDQNPGCVLLFRMGDFYELFGEDARIASRVLGLTLTSRTKGEGAIPMAGVPYHAADGYIQKLIHAGYRVAVCDQVEDASQAKGLVRREVTRVLSAGTLLDGQMLTESENNYLAAIYRRGATGLGPVGLAYVDLSTGEFVVAELSEEEFLDEIDRIRPSEILLPESRAREDEEPYVGRGERAKRERRVRTGPEQAPPPPAGTSPDDEASPPSPPPPPTKRAAIITPIPDWTFELETARRTLLEHFGVATLEGFGCENLPLAIGAAGAILRYLAETQKSALAHLDRIRTLDLGAFVSLDAATIRNLELIETARERRKAGSLLGLLDRTRTAMGARQLRQWLLRPLRGVAAIRRRQGAVAQLASDMLLREGLREGLGKVQDLERLAVRVAARRANARDLLALAESLLQAPAIAELIDSGATCEPLLAEIAGSLREGAQPAAAGLQADEGRAWIDQIVQTLRDEAPAGLREGGLIRDGVDAELDRLRQIRSGGKDWIARLQVAEAKRTGIASLKVGYNKVFGYYIEVTKANERLVPDDYVRKQTLTNAERYITPALKEREAEVLGAEEKIVEREYELFVALRERAAGHVRQAQEVARALAELDAIASLAEVAARANYVCPEVDDSRILEVRDGRHPTLEAQMAPGQFVPNDLDIDADARQILLVTGPNMAGKSTYIRSAALWLLMAQMGSFVPASAARIGIADRIFTRVGASDDLGRGQSTFMVEMVETAHILNSATDSSFIVLDEVGRGTSTFDGVAIAWAVVEHLHERAGARARTLFATHYHELTELARTLPRLATCNVSVREWQGEITFLHKIVPGASDRSYGIHVAKIAGVPQAVVARAWEILEILERKTGEAGSPGAADLIKRARRRGPASRQALQLSLFAPPDIPAPDSAALKDLAKTETANLTPLQALQHLDELVKRARQELADDDPA